MNRLLIVTFAFLICSCDSDSSNPAGNSSKGGSRRGVTESNFNKIKLPTTLGAVIDIMGRGPDTSNNINFHWQSEDRQYLISAFGRTDRIEAKHYHDNPGGFVLIENYIEGQGIIKQRQNFRATP